MRTRTEQTRLLCRETHMSRIAIFVTLAGVLMAGWLSLARADVYRWVDKHGMVHYSDQWRPGATRIMTATGSLSESSGQSSGAMQGIATGSQAADKSIQKAADERAVAATEAKLRAERCKKAKAVYNHLLYARRLYTTDKSGERHYVSDAQADADRVKARETMAALCGGGTSP